MKIGVIGANTLGVAFSLLCENAGYNVTIYDENEDIVFNLNNEIYKTNEPLVQKMLFESYDFSATTNVVELINKCDTIFTFINTEPTLDGGNDTSKVFEVSNHFFTASQLDIPIHNKKFIIGSTMNPGETEQVQEKLNMFNIQVGYCPSMSSEGDIINGYYKSDMVLIGTEYQELSNHLLQIYNKIQPNGINIHTMSLKSAEIVKLSINSFISMKISFVNMLGDLLVKSKLDGEINSILHSIGSDSRIGTKSMKYGFGYGGHNLPRDTKTLTDYLNNYEVDSTLISSVKESNDNHSKFLKEYYTTQNPDKDIPFVFDNIGFKKNISDLTNSQQYKLCLELLEEGYIINLIIDRENIKYINTLIESHNGRLKIFPKGTNPEGFKINL